MKKGTTVESGYDVKGRWHLKLRKAKGKFTLDEIIEAAKEWEEDYYAVIIKAMSDETAQYYDDDLEGGLRDAISCYRFYQQRGVTNEKINFKSRQRNQG